MNRSSIGFSRCYSAEIAAECGSNDIAVATDLSRPAVSHHLQILKDAGIVKVRKEATTLPPSTPKTGKTKGFSAATSMEADT